MKAIDVVASLRCPNCKQERKVFDGTNWKLNNLGDFEIHCTCGHHVVARLVLENTPAYSKAKVFATADEQPIDREEWEKWEAEKARACRCICHKRESFDCCKRNHHCFYCHNTHAFELRDGCGLKAVPVSEGG